ncbi:hypothetical protein BJY01DRAFT_106165 [Aspergillus pseudoustus]|uniref:Uncharacterized protein n=1 Tax=Aspergillus pseudoustus TaxID=1810923 RepID=A0ABR4IV68_9EURO
MVHVSSTIDWPFSNKYSQLTARTARKLAVKSPQNIHRGRFFASELLQGMTRQHQPPQPVSRIAYHRQGREKQINCEQLGTHSRATCRTRAQQQGGVPAGLVSLRSVESEGQEACHRTEESGVGMFPKDGKRFMQLDNGAERQHDDLPPRELTSVNSAGH